MFFVLLHKGTKYHDRFTVYLMLNKRKPLRVPFYLK